MIDVQIDTYDVDYIENNELNKLENVLNMVATEYVESTLKFPKFASPHEGLAIIQEEFEEFKESVFWPHKDHTGEAQEEARQLAAMAIRYLMDVSYK